MGGRVHVHLLLLMVKSGEGGPAGDLEPDSQADKEQGGNATAHHDQRRRNPVIVGPPRP
jgi:hypothetical protein